jgi:hypothetical protein
MSVFDNVMKHGGNSLVFGVNLEHDPQRMQDARLSGFVGLACVRFGTSDLCSSWHSRIKPNGQSQCGGVSAKPSCNTPMFVSRDTP